MTGRAYNKKLVPSKTSGGGNNCLLHSILPYMGPYLLRDSQFRQVFTQYWQLNRSMGEDEFQRKLQPLLGSQSDLEKLLGPVLRQFLAGQLRQAYKDYQQDSVSEISLGYDKKLTVDKIRGEDSNPFRNTDDESLQRQLGGMSECVANFLAAAKGFHDSFAGHDPAPNNVDDFDDYIDQLERGNVFISLGDISLLARRYDLEFDWFSPSKPYGAVVNKEHSSEKQRIIVWYNGINHFEYCPNQSHTCLLDQNKPAQLKDEQGFTYNKYSAIKQFIQHKLDQKKQHLQSQHTLNNTNNLSGNNQNHASSLRKIAYDLNQRLVSKNHQEPLDSKGFEEEQSLKTYTTENYQAIKQDYKALRDIWHQRSDLQNLEKQTNNYSIIQGFFSHNTVVGEGDDETITMTNEQSAPTNNASKQDETQVQKDYYIALAEQLKEVANGLSDAEEQLEHSSMPGPKK